MVAAGLLLAAGPVWGQFNPGSYYRIKSQSSGKCLDIYGISLQNGAPAVQWDNNGGYNQEWQILDTGGGYFKLISRNSGKCLDVAGVSLQDGGRVQQWDYFGNDNQRWGIVALPGGGYSFTAKHSNMLLQVANNSLNNGAMVQQGTAQSCSSGGTQVVSAAQLTNGIQPISIAQSASEAGTSGNVSSPKSTTGRLAAYPNPANDFITVLLSNGERPTAPVSVYDALGRLVPHQPLDGNGRMAVGQLPSGSYALAVGQGGQQLRQRIVVAHEGSAAASTGQALVLAGAQSATLATANGTCPQAWYVEEISGTVVPSIASPTTDLTTYRQLAQNYSLASGMTYRYGSPSTLDNSGLPTQYKPSDKHFDNHGNGNGWDYEVAGPQNANINDFSTNQGQILHVADNPSDVGVDVVQSLLMAENTYSSKPQLPWVYYGGGHPDPDALDYAATTGALHQPTAIGRSYGFAGWASNDIVCFQSGVIAAFGTNTSRGTAWLKLPANKVPTAVAITDNNEFALVTVWDTDALKGQVAVLALGTGNGFWGDWTYVYPGLRNRGLFTFIKLLGYVDLPGVTQPTEISASTDFAATSDAYSGWMQSPDGSDGRYHELQLPLNNETNRQSFIGGPNRYRYSKGGFAVITSKAEKKVVFLDLNPLFDQMQRMYFGSLSNFNLTQNVGQQDGQWPYAFSVAPGSAPVVVKTVSLTQAPTAVRTSLAPGVNQAYVATQDGTLHVFSVGGYGTATGGTPTDIAEVGSVAVGSNPTSIAYVKDKGWGNASTLGTQLIVVVRGERAIKWVKLAGTTGSVFKTLRDSRLLDPVWVEDNDNHGTESSLVSVADYSGKQIANYRYGPVVFHTNGGATYNMGSSGTDEFEFGGSYPVAGRPFQFSGTNVP